MTFTLFWVFGCLLSVTSAVPRESLRPCTSSWDCMEGECCRERDGRIAVADPESWLFSFKYTGICVPGNANLNEPCNFKCGCNEGLKCYRKITGVCCQPRRCWSKEDVEKDRNKFQNCFLDKAKKIHCPLPM